MSGIIGLLKTERPYRRLLSASLLSGIGDWFSNVALLGLLIHLTDSGLVVGITLMVRTLPYLVMGPVGGYLADKLNRKTILLVSDFARALVALSFLFIHSAGTVWIAYAATLGLVMFSALFTPARTAMIPQLVKRDGVVQANALEQSTIGLVMAIGCTLGSIVAALYGTNTAFVMNAVSFLISGLICSTIKLPKRARESHSTQETTEEPDCTSFWHLLSSSRLLQVISAQELLWAVGGGVVNVLISIYGYQVFHKGNVGIGMLYGSLGAGFVISGLTSNYFKSRLPQAILIGFVVEGLCHILVSQSPNIWIASICLIVATTAGGIGNAAVMTLLMHRIHPKFHGRSFAFMNTVSCVTLALSMMASGILVTVVSARMLGLMAGFLLTLVSAATGTWLLRLHYRRTPCNKAHCRQNETGFSS